MIGKCREKTAVEGECVNTKRWSYKSHRITQGDPDDASTGLAAELENKCVQFEFSGCGDPKGKSVYSPQLDVAKKGTVRD